MDLVPGFTLGAAVNRRARERELELQSSRYAYSFGARPKTIRTGRAPNEAFEESTYGITDTTTAMLLPFSVR